MSAIPYPSSFPRNQIIGICKSCSKPIGAKPADEMYIEIRMSTGYYGLSNTHESIMFHPKCFEEIAGSEYIPKEKSITGKEIDKIFAFQNIQAYNTIQEYEDLKNSIVKQTFGIEKNILGNVLEEEEKK